MIKPAGELIAAAQSQIECIDVAEAKKLFDDRDKVIIIDVREADSANESKLQDSVNISRGLLEMKTHKHIPDAETIILTHCGGGGRASLAALTLKQMGYKNAYAITAPYDEIKKAFG
ncbi:MAG: rhodanese-like domain-containing protein [Gammaproteobacteria bacterium]|nr:rhodanese-like domain-containing protein [Gammaproteobacteria bacterium]